MAVKKTGSSAKKAAAADKNAKGAVRSTAKKTTVKKETAEVQAKAPSEQEFSVFVTDLDQYLAELKYLYDFVKYRELEEDFRFFRENAHLDQNEDLPFPRYVL